MKTLSFLFTLLLLSPAGSAAEQADTQTLPEGFPFSVSYTRGVDYFGALQTWGIIRDANGILFFGNTNYGIQQFDGSNWRYIRTPGSSAALSFDTDAAGRVYAGTHTAFGRIDPDQTGQFQFTSLLPDALGPTGEIRFTRVMGDEVWFISPEKAYIYTISTGEVRVMPAQGRFTGAALTAEALWLNDSQKGLLKLTEEGTEPLITTPFGPGRHRLTLLSNQLAVLTTDHVVWVQTDDTWTRKAVLDTAGIAVFPPADDVLGLHDGSLALASTQGVFLFNETGSLRSHFTSENLLTVDIAYRLYQDADGTLWVSGANGITGIEIARKMREFLPVQGLPESGLNGVTEFRGQVFVATNNEGLFVGSGDNFRLILEGNVINNFAASAAGPLIAASEGLFLYDAEGRLRPVFTEGYVQRVFRSRSEEDLFYFVAWGDGIWAARLLPDQTFSLRRLFEFSTSVFTIDEGREGHIWLGTGRNGIIRLEVNREPGQFPQVIAHRVFTTADGLPADGFNFTKQLPDDVGFITEAGFYRLSDDRNAIVKDTRFESFFGEGGGLRVWPVTPGRDGSNWVARAAWRIGRTVYNPATGLFDWHEGEYTRMAVYRDVTNIFEGDSGRIYFHSFNRIGYYDPEVVSKPLPVFRTHITHIVASDSLVYAGWGRSFNTGRPQFAYGSNSLRFNFGLISFASATNNQYQFYLEGADTGWSDWSQERYADYRNLREGTYTFHVRGRNLYLTPSEPASFTFTILPPWYRSSLAYLVYSLFFIGIVLGYSKWRTQKLMLRQAELEAEVEARTAEVRKKSAQLEKLDKVKSTFFSNVSHEFRTPLTLIKGPVEQLLGDTNLSTAEKVAQYGRIKENAERLLSLIDRILSLSKMESGTYVLQLRRTDLHAMLRKIAGWYEPLARQKGLAFEVRIPAEPFLIYADQEQAELLFSNLLSNAVKYTEKGSLRISCEVTEGEAEVRIQDTGIGIPASEQQQVFERYYRAKSGLLSNSGSGIGLNLVSFVAGMHGMEVNLASAEGQGTEVRIGCRAGLAHIGTEYTILEGDDSFDSGHSEEKRKPYEAFQEQIAAVSADDAEADDQDAADIPLLLIADDNAGIRAFIRSVMGAAYRFAECADGHQLIQKARLLQPDLILSDVMMPGLDGITASRRLKADPETRHIPVIMITAKGGSENELTGLESGASDYIAKPFSPDILKARVKGQLAIRQELRSWLQRQLRGASAAEAKEHKGESYPGGWDSNASANGNRNGNGSAGEGQGQGQSAEDEAFTQEVLAKIRENISNPEFTVENLAFGLNMSRSSLYRKLKLPGNESPNDLINRMRLEIARDLLKQKNNSISEIAYAVGYNSLSYFSRMYKKQYGHRPSEV
ncbi:MAG: response regulator [Balneolales bacterium]|nr:response regulator [Balneolales bacterium]